MMRGHIEKLKRPKIETSTYRNDCAYGLRLFDFSIFRRLVVVALLIGVGIGEVAAADTTVLVADRYVAPDGTIKSDILIVVANGRISRIVPEEPEGVDAKPGVVDHYPGAVVCPGLIDVRSAVGAYGSNQEEAFAIDPGASAIELVDRNHPVFRAAAVAGITSVLLMPGDGNLISGAAAVVKTVVVDGKGARRDSRTSSSRTSRSRSSGRRGVPGVVRDDGPLVFSLGQSPLRFDRAPTSRGGAVAMLRESLRKAKDGVGHQRLVDFVGGRLDGLVVCDEAMDVDAAVNLFGGMNLSLTLVFTGAASDVSAGLSDVFRATATGPYDYTMSPNALSHAAALAKSGNLVALVARAPGGAPDGLRVTAALAARYGLDASLARSAMTFSAARAVGVADRIGSIEQGKDADFVIFSDDPLRLDARVLAVYVDGVRVYSRELEETP